MAVAQIVGMYGYGGQGDELTNIHSSILFGYDYHVARLIDCAEVCGAPGMGPWWHWVVDNCPLDSVQEGPSSPVDHHGHGAYHCDPPSVNPCSFVFGGYHALHAMEVAYPDGAAYCYFWYSGYIMGDVQRVAANCYLDNP